MRLFLVREEAKVAVLVDSNKGAHVSNLIDLLARSLDATNLEEEKGRT
jgi:hypothetical protein